MDIDNKIIERIEELERELDERYKEREERINKKLRNIKEHNITQKFN